MIARAVAHALFRHQRKMLLVLSACLAAGAGAAVLEPVAWRAEATLMTDKPENARALAALLESRDLHQGLMAGMGEVLYPGLSGPERVEKFGHALAVAPIPNSPVVRVSLDHEDAKAATRALSTLIEALHEKNRVVFATDGAAATRAATAVEKLNLARRRAEIEAEAAGAEAEAAALSEKLTMLKQRLSATPQTIALATESERSRVAEDARAKLFELESREAELLGKYTDNSTLVRNVQAERRKIEQLLTQLDNATQSKVTNGANPIYQEVEKESFRTESALSSARARLKSAQKLMADLDKRLDDPRPLADLERDVTLLQSRRTGAAQALDGIGVVQHADAGTHPAGFGPWRIMAAAAAIGVLLALLTAWAAQRFSSRLATPADVEGRLGLPVLTSIPRES